MTASLRSKSVEHDIGTKASMFSANDCISVYHFPNMFHFANDKNDSPVPYRACFYINPAAKSLQSFFHTEN